MAGMTMWCLLALFSTTGAILDTAAQHEIRQVIEAGMQCKSIPGLSVAIVKDGQVLLSEGYGLRDFGHRRPVTANTQFMIASLTKAFTATLLSDVVAGISGKGISTNVYKTIEGGFRFNNTLRSTYATMEDLLAHRTGIPRNNYARLASDFSIHSFARKIRYLPHRGGFRDSFYYNDLMYGLSAYITEQLANRPWKLQMRETIFNPLGMNGSTFIDDMNFSTSDVATPYARESGQTLRASVDFIQHWGKNLGSGNIMSTANDMSKWMLMLLNRGRDQSGRRVLREGVVEETFTAQNVFPPTSYSANYKVPVTPESFTFDTYSLGWRIGYYKGYQLIHHSGSSFGYRAYLSLLPDMNVGVVTLMTGSDYQQKFRTALHMYLMDRALGHTPWINTSSICSYPDPWRSASRSRRSAYSSQDEEVSRPRRSVHNFQEEEEEFEEEDDDMSVVEASKPHINHRQKRASFRLSRYVGNYRHMAYGTLNVSYNSTMRSLVLRFGVGLWRLSSTGGHSFDGLWLNGPPTINKNFRFKTRGLSVYAVEGVGFEPSKPPVFYR